MKNINNQFKNIILHIPHSAVNIPLKEGFVATEGVINAEMLKLTDWYTDDLFLHEEIVQIVAPFSRLFCDVERFPDDKVEIMAKYGMGMLYTRLDDGSPLRVINSILREKVKKEYYDPHHDRITQEVEKQLERFNSCLIIDCHSFSSKPFLRDMDKEEPRPDICIGTDSFHTPQVLIDIAKKYFEKNGLNCKVNTPYSGTMVPLRYYKKDKRVQSIMIEVNRDLYLVPGTNEKNENYDAIKNILSGFIDELINGSDIEEAYK